MREIILDTETTGTDPAAGDRVIEIGCVELVNQFPTGRTFHAYVNPQRSVSQGAFNVHGLSEAFLADKPVFAAVAEPLPGVHRRRAARHPQRRRSTSPS